MWGWHYSYSSKCPLWIYHLWYGFVLEEQIKKMNDITCTLLQFQYNVYDSMVDNTIRIMSIHYNIDKKNIILIDNTIRVCCIETLGKDIKSS